MILNTGLHGKRILVTGASGDIGGEISCLLNSLGAHVILSGRDLEKLRTNQSNLDKGISSIESFALNDTEAIPDWLKQISLNYGSLYGIVHAAGITATMPTRLMKWEKASHIMMANWGSAWALAKGFRQRNVYELDGSRLVFIASSAGLIGEQAMSAYSSSKGAIISMVRSLAAEYACDKINVNAIAPGFIMTSMNKKFIQSIDTKQIEAIKGRHPLGFGAAEDVAAAVAFLLGSTGRWVTGVTIPVDGGLTAV